MWHGHGCTGHIGSYAHVYAQWPPYRAKSVSKTSLQAESWKERPIFQAFDVITAKSCYFQNKQYTQLAGHSIQSSLLYWMGNKS